MWLLLPNRWPKAEAAARVDSDINAIPLNTTDHPSPASICNVKGQAVAAQLAPGDPEATP